MTQPRTFDGRVTQLRTPAELLHHLPALRALLQSLVNDDPAKSSIGFRAPLSDADADEFWTATSAKLAQEPATLYMFVLTAEPTEQEPEPPLVATVQLVTSTKVTHAHRGEVAKLMVSPELQGYGLGRLMMAHVERFARDEMGKEMLTLDTAAELPARRFYNHLGWQEWGTCPQYAENAAGKRGDVTFFVKFLK